MRFGICAAIRVKGKLSVMKLTQLDLIKGGIKDVKR